MDTELAPLIEKAAAALKAAGAREVYLFGSASKGNLRPGSDGRLGGLRTATRGLFRPMGKASRALGRPVDLIDLDVESPFTRYLKEEGELQRVG